MNKKIIFLVLISACITLIVVGIGFIPSEKVNSEESDQPVRIGDGNMQRTNILDTVTYKITNIDKFDTTITANITYTFDKEVTEGSINIEPPFGSNGNIIESNANVRDNTIRFSEPRRQVQLQYRINITDIGVRSILSSHTFMNWWDTSGEVRTDSRTYELDYDVTDEYVSVEHKSLIGEGFVGHLYTNASITYTDDVFYISDNFEPDTYILESDENVDARVHNLTQNEVNISGIVKRFNMVQNSDLERINKNNQDVDIFIHPRDTYRYTGGSLFRTSSDVTLWVSEETVNDQYSTTVSHEIIHSVQKHTTSHNMQWWIEGSAQYISGLLEYEAQGYKNEKYIRETTLESDWHNTQQATVGDTSELKPKFDNNTLSDPDTWNGDVDYRRGARILYLIDVKIRSTSDENILTLFNWMNRHEGKVTYQEFRSKIVNLTDESFAKKIDAYVHQNQIINVENEMSDILGSDFTPRLPQYTFISSNDYTYAHCSQIDGSSCISYDP